MSINFFSYNQQYNNIFLKNIEHIIEKIKNNTKNLY